MLEGLWLENCTVLRAQGWLCTAMFTQLETCLLLMRHEQVQEGGGVKGVGFRGVHRI